jgi:NADP-dependent 3-hydroxy acid dehydrogenase YdfG
VIIYRTALVTGATRGIGLAVARRLLEQKMRVALVARGISAADDLVKEFGDRALPVACDVGDAAAVESMASRVVGAFGEAPDVIVNNAGLFNLATVEQTSGNDFAAALDVNLVAPFRVIRAFLPAMRARARGHIVNIGSIADRVTFPENGAYAASKFGLRALHQVLRSEVAGSGVRATLVSPGPVDTALWDEIDPDNRPGFSPRASMLRPEAVANAVLYAISQPDSVNVDELRLSRA